MSKKSISIQNVSKQYRLGEVGTGTLSHDLNRWWHKIRDKEDPYLKVGDINVRDKEGGSDLVWALKDINIEVKQGEILGIIGKNGAGKSTLLKILSKVTGPTTGKISMRGRMASLLEVGTGFHRELTGRENIYLNGAILGMTKSEIKKNLDEIVDFSGVAKYLDTPVKRYSSGMMVRLGFAVAAHLEPEILIVDEVLAVGDVQFQRKAVGKMKDVSEGGERTVLFVSHNMGSIQNLCSRTILLSDGMIDFDGETETAIAKYSQANMLGSSVKGSTKFKYTLSEFKPIALTGLEIKNEFGDIIEIIHTGQKFEFHLPYKSIESKFDKIEISIALIDTGQAFVVGYNSLMVSGEFMSINSQEGVFVCKVPKFHIQPGEYQVIINLTVNGVSVQVVENAMNLSVEEGDFYGTGRIYPNLIVKTIAEHSWNVQ